MPNIRESLYQCLENKVVAASTTPVMELFTVDPSCKAYAITVYVVYNNTSFLEINLNSGMIKNGNSEIGYYRIRQAALQSGEINNLYLVPSLNGKTYYLQLSNVTVNSDIFIRKDIKFGVYSKLLTSISAESVADSYKLTTIAFDNYNPDKAYSNGYFVESNDHTFVRQLLSKDNNGILGQHDVPFENAYVTTITTKNILNSYRYTKYVLTAQTYESGEYYTKDDSGMYILATGEFDAEKEYFKKELNSEKLSIGENDDRIEAIYTDNVNTSTIDTGTIDLGEFLAGTNIRSVSIGGTIDKLGTDESDIRKPKKSGFWNNGILEVRYTDDDHIFTQYVRDENDAMKQQIVVPGGLSISGTGNFTNAAISGHLYLNSSAANSNVLNALYIDENGEIHSRDLTLVANDAKDMTGENAHKGGLLDFVSKVTQDSDGKVKYEHSKVSVRNSYTDSVDDALFKYRPVNSLAVKDAIETLDVSDISGFGVDKTLATLTETDGKISATFQDITVKDSHVKVNELKANGTYPYGDLTENDAESTIVAALSKRARTLHAHGYIDANGNMVQAAIHSGDQTTGNRLLFADNSQAGGGRIKELAVGFDTSNGKEWSLLNQKGAWTAVSVATLGAATSGHDHGNILNSGKITAAGVDIANTFNFVLTNASDEVVRSSIAFDGSTTSKYLSQKGTWEDVPTLSSLGGATSDHDHHNIYVRHDVNNQGLDSANKQNARTNIGAGTVNSVKVTSGGTISVTGDTTITGSGTVNVDLPALYEFASGITSASTAVSTNSTLSYDTTDKGYNIVTPVVTVDAYGRAVSVSESKKQLIKGHTAEYDLTDGVLTITVM